MAEAARPVAAAEGRAPLVSLRGVGKRFATGTEALRDVSFDVGAGAFVSLLGPSGCGKSTILRLIAGLAEPSAGDIRWTGTANGARPADIGFVFQEPTLMPWATVFDNVRLPLRLRGEGKSAVRDRVMATLRRVGLEAFAAAYPRELSGGMKMRVSLARALIVEPQLLLMDEPFAALDEITRSRLDEDLLALWQAERWTVVFVTHSVFESAYLSERILVMMPRPGRIAADIAVGAPYPRDAAYRTSPAYNAVCREASAALDAAMAGELAR
ncbi:MAG: ABC transporter ATP-binding protein [Bauldia sp.]|nr:ABC transporter ATP-binding protein [Bauldia sp.]